MWRVGNGESIKIWEDRWIPKPTLYTIQTPVRVLNGAAKVSSLLYTVTNWWKVDLIHSIFNEEEASTICSVVLCPQRRKDWLVWTATKNGVFNVHSAYHLAKERFVENEGSCEVLPLEGMQQHLTYKRKSVLKENYG
jgi:hypothetical protein